MSDGWFARGVALIVVAAVAAFLVVIAVQRYDAHQRQQSRQHQLQQACNGSNGLSAQLGDVISGNCPTTTTS
jgi:type II secretory pathway component PulK